MEKKIIKEIAVELLKPLLGMLDRGVPMMAGIITKDTAKLIQLPDYESKEETALAVMSVAALTDDVEAVVFISESWGVELDDPELVERFGSDTNKIMAWIRKRWPSLADCPYRKECLIVTVDQGSEEYTASIEMKRDQDGKIIWGEYTADVFHDQPVREKIDYTVNFNQLKQKADIIKDMLELGAKIPEPFRPEPKRILEMVLQSFVEKVEYKANCASVAYYAWGITEKMNEVACVRRKSPVPKKDLH